MKFNMELPKEKCRACKYMSQLSSTHHISCTKKNVIVEGSNHGINNGWFFFPFNFDPIWLDNCTSFRPKNEKLEDLSTDYLVGLVLYNLKLISLQSRMNIMLILDIVKERDIENRTNLFFEKFPNKKALDTISEEDRIILINIVNDLINI